MPETVTLTKKEYYELMEELAILRDPEIMDAIRENEEAKKRGVKPWKLHL